MARPYVASDALNAGARNRRRSSSGSGEPELAAHEHHAERQTRRG